jgi:hypothetical protein
MGVRVRRDTERAMSQEKVDRLRELYADWAQGDFGTTGDYFDPEVEFQWTWPSRWTALGQRLGDFERPAVCDDECPVGPPHSVTRSPWAAEVADVYEARGNAQEKMVPSLRDLWPAYA